MGPGRSGTASPASSATRLAIDNVSRPNPRASDVRHRSTRRYVSDSADLRKTTLNSIHTRAFVIRPPTRLLACTMSPLTLYITGTSVEERSRHTVTWEASCNGVTFARVQASDMSTMALEVEGARSVVLLRSTASIDGLLNGEQYAAYYLDITGLSHHVWAPLLKGLARRPEPVFAVYVEPGDYRLSETPTEATIFDLSEKIEGIAPLPGFASLAVNLEVETLLFHCLVSKVRGSHHAGNRTAEARGRRASCWCAGISTGISILYICRESN